MCLGQDADLHVSQPMPLPLNISCSSKSRLVLPFCCRLTWVVLDKIQEGHKMVVCVCVCHQGAPCCLTLQLYSFAEYGTVGTASIVCNCHFYHELFLSNSTLICQDNLSPNCQEGLSWLTCCSLVIVVQSMGLVSLQTWINWQNARNCWKILYLHHCYCLFNICTGNRSQQAAIDFMLWIFILSPGIWKRYWCQKAGVPHTPSNVSCVISLVVYEAVSRSVDGFLCSEFISMLWHCWLVTGSTFCLWNVCYLFHQFCSGTSRERTPWGQVTNVHVENNC